MTRHDIIEKLHWYAGPQGPPVGVYRSRAPKDEQEALEMIFKEVEEELEAIEAEIRAWVDSLPFDTIDAFLELLAHPPNSADCDELTLLRIESGWGAVIDIAVHEFMKRDPAAFVQKAQPYLDDPVAGPDLREFLDEL